MTNYNSYTWPSSSIGYSHYKKNKRHLFNEEHEKTYEALGSDKVLQAYSSNINKYRPRTLARDPSTFAFYGKAEQYYKDAASTILDYYPFDGSRSELLSWYHSASSLDVALLHQEWPTNVGHVNLSGDAYVLAYAGPESIPEAEYVGNYKNEFNGLKIDLHEGLTIEFWIKSPAIDYQANTVSSLFEVGTFPGKMPNAQDPSNISASDEDLISTIRTLIPAGARVRFRTFNALFNATIDTLAFLKLDVTAINTGGNIVADLEFVPPDVNVFDDSWHHIAIRLKHKTTNEVVCDWFIDGKLEKSQEETIDFVPPGADWDDDFPNSGFGPYNKFMAASLGNSLFRASKSLPGNFPVSLDSFRVWQGERSNKEINKYYDQKVFASEFDPEVPMSSSLGLNLTFNEATSGISDKDKIALDYSGNEITSVIYNYTDSTRVNTSAIDSTSVSLNTEPKDPILSKTHQEVVDLERDLKEIAESYDLQNFNLLRNYLPDWTHSNVFGNESKQEMDFLLHLMATAFDSIKVNLDAMRKLTRPEYEQSSKQLDLISEADAPVDDQTILGISNSTVINPVPAQNKIDFSKRILANYGFGESEFDLFWTLNSQEIIESLIGNLRLQNTIEETKSLIFDCLANAAAFSLNKKGTRTAYNAFLNAAGLGEELITFNLYGQNAEIKIDDKTEISSKKIKSLNFSDNPDGILYLDGLIHRPWTNEVIFVEEGPTLSYQGNFIFPLPKPGKDHAFLTSSVFYFGDFPAAVENAENTARRIKNTFYVSVEKQNNFSNAAKFKLTFPDQNDVGQATLQTPIIQNVYDSNPWSLAVTISKVLGDTFHNATARQTDYVLNFFGHKCLAGEILDSFHLTVPIDTTQVGHALGRSHFQGQGFVTAVAVGANRKFVQSGIRGGPSDVLQQTDIKTLSFSAWNTDLKEEELIQNALTLTGYGVNDIYRINENYVDQNFPDKHLTRRDQQIFQIQFDGLNEVDTTPLTVQNLILDSEIRRGHGLGISVIELEELNNRTLVPGNFKTFGFGNNPEDTCQIEFIPVLKKLPLLNLVSDSGVELKSQEFDKFDLKTKPERKIASFEKSMYRVISSEMALFLSSMKNFNELIGAPVNKYRRSYKSLDSLRQNFFSIVQETAQVEKFINYYKWIDKTIGHFLRQITPASLEVNSGIENVIESHLFERPKINHKLARIKNFSNLTDTIVSAAGFTANNYSWSVGHFTEVENENPTYDKFRSETDSDRSDLVSVFRGTRNKTGAQYFNFDKFSQENLSKIYKEDVDLEKIITLGKNKSSSKSDDDVWRVVLPGEKLVIDSDSFEELMGVVASEHKEIPVRTKILGADGEVKSTTYAKDSLVFKFMANSNSDDLGSLKQGIEITNVHHSSDTLQGPWVKDNVSIYQFEGIEIGKEAALRPEAYKITNEGSGGDLIIEVLQGPLTLIKKSAAATVYNVRNIKTDTSSGKVGNYKESYEVVQTVGTSGLKLKEVIDPKTAATESTHLSDLVDYPKKTSETKQKVAFVSKFSTTGLPASIGSDLQQEEMSVYNSMNYRNLLARTVLDCISSDSSGKNGRRTQLGSLGQEVGSWHKTPKNTTYRTTSEGNKEINDNFFVQSHMPQTDFSYSWIKKAADEDVFSFLSKNSNLGHNSSFETPGSESSSASIKFLLSSEAEPELDFVGLNGVNSKSIDEDTNTIINNSSDLNTVLLNGGGTFGWPSWKMTRNSNNPVVRMERKKNIISITSRGEEPLARKFKGTQFDYGNTKEDNEIKKVNRQIKRFEEIPVTNRYSPMKISIASEYAPTRTSVTYTEQQNEFFKWRSQSKDKYSSEYVGPKRITVSSSPQNSVSGFANEELSEALKFREKRLEDTQSLQSLNYFILLALEDDFLSLNNSVISYKEKIYPREINSYKKKARKRENYEYFPWDSTRENRKNVLQGNINYGNYFFSGVNLLPEANIISQADYKKTHFSQYDAVDLNSVTDSNSISSILPITQSSWPLDSREQFSSFPCEITETFYTSPSSFMANRNQATFGEGILQNDFSIFPLGINNLHGAPPLAPVYNRRIPFTHNASTYLAGEAQWEAATGRTVGPFYDNYEDFSKNLATIGRQYSLVPEFRISNFVETLLSQQNAEQLTNNMDNFLEVEGANPAVSSGDLSLGGEFFKTYSNSDFLKYFNIVKENPVMQQAGYSQDTLTLRCKAIKKLLPYKGFYPAERVVEIANIFNRTYLPESSYDYELLDNTMFASNSTEAKTLLKARIQNSKTQVIKPLLAPGILLNSIKSGIAVDYPIFNSDVTNALDVIYQATDDSPTDMFSALSSIGEDSSLPFKGSEINSSTDTGIERISGTVSTRITFEDLMNPEDLFGLIIHDNEPHPAATSLYGSNLHFSILERPPTFGSLNKEKTIKNTAIDFKNTRESFAESIRPFKSAVNNFAAETVNFFLEGSSLTSFISEAVNPKLEKGTEYKMFVHLDNKGVMMYDRHSAFGPPVDEGTINVKSYSVSSNSTAGTAATATVSFNGHSSSTLIDETATFVDYNNLSKTYIFKEDISSTSATPATATIDLSSVSSATSLSGENFTLEDSSQLEKTYRFIEDSSGSTTPGTASSGWVDFGDMEDGKAGSLDGGKIVLEDTTGTSHTYRFRTGDYSAEADQRFYIGTGDVSSGKLDDLVIEFEELDSQNATTTTTTSFIFVSESYVGLNAQDSNGNWKIGLLDTSLNYVSSAQVLLNFRYVVENKTGFTGSATSSYVVFTQPYKGYSGNSSVTVSGGPTTPVWTSSNKASAGNESDGSTTLWGDFKDGVDTLSSGEVVPTAHPITAYHGDIFVNTSSVYTAADMASEFRNAINNSSANSAPFDASASGNRTTITQDVVGTAGDTSITLDSIIQTALTATPDNTDKQDFTGGVNSSSTGAVTYNAGDVLTAHSNQIAIPITGRTIDQVGQEIIDAIGHSNGHNTTISVSWSTASDIASLTQATSGIAGNNTIGYSAGLNGFISGFANGQAGSTGTNYTTGELESQNVVVDITGLSSVSDIASELITAITGLNGHNSTIVQEGSFNNSTEVLTLKQGSVGLSGNTTNNSTVSNFVSNFTLGTDATSATAKTLVEQTTQLQDSHGFLPFVPPFLDPNTSPYVEISFTPSETKEYTIPEIIDGSIKTFYNIEAPSNPGTNCNYKNAMNLEASLDLNTFFLEESTKNNKEQKFRWIIQTKWETPVLNFLNKPVQAINLSTSEVESVQSSPWKSRTQDNYYKIESTNTHLPSSRGMWHQYGDILGENTSDGYILSLSEPEETTSPKVKSLSKVLGFVKDSNNKNRNIEKSKKNETKLGKLAENKKVFESVVAIPYYLDEQQKICLFEINDGTLEQGSSPAASDYNRQINLMNKYIIPPHFDFLINTNVKPHIQYIFEFSTSFTKQDLSDIWQNLYPENSKAATARKSSVFPENNNSVEGDKEFCTSSIKINNSAYRDAEIFENEKVRWIVFKAKYRGIHNYEQVKKRRLSSSETSFAVDNQTANEYTNFVYDNYGFNWPYDYFSIVELIELSAKVDFSIGSIAQPTTEVQIIQECETTQQDTDLTDEAESIQTEATIINNNYITVESGGSSCDDLLNTEFTQVLKHTDTSAPSTPNQISVPLPNGYSLKPGSYSVFLNGVLQTEGASNDFILSSGVITTALDLNYSDNLTIKYKLQQDS